MVFPLGLDIGKINITPFPYVVRPTLGYWEGCVAEQNQLLSPFGSLYIISIGKNKSPLAKVEGNANYLFFNPLSSIDVACIQRICVQPFFGFWIRSCQ